MSTLTIRMASDKHARLKALAENRKISVNRLIDELATVALANHDARLRYDVRARRGNKQRALQLLAEIGAR
jgi:predicted DNA-binding ribbon-helix-helix protein